jgi:hypothetical protein
MDKEAANFGGMTTGMQYPQEVFQFFMHRILEEYLDKEAERYMNTLRMQCISASEYTVSCLCKKYPNLGPVFLDRAYEIINKNHEDVV